MNEQTGSVVLADVISEFLEVAFHLIIFVRGIYPPELFESTQKYSCPIKTARHPGLKAYIQQIVHSLRAELLKDTIHRICVVTLDSSTRPVDRFVFEMSVLKSFEDLHQVVQQPPQQPPAVIHGNDNYHLQHADEGHDVHNQDQGQQSETIAPRLDKGKGKAIEYQRHDMEDNNVVGDEDMESDGGFETDHYDGYGGGHEQELEPGKDEQGHHVAVEGEEGEGCDEEEYDYEDDGEAPLVRKIRSVQDQSATTNATVSLARVQAAGERRGYKTRIGRDGGSGRHETPHFGARVDVTTDLETMLRAMLLKISICDAHLTPLAPESSFTVVVEMKNNGPGPEAKADFPWSPISPASHEEQLKVSAAAPPTQPLLQQRKIIPVKTVDVADIQLELYLEKFNG